MISLYPAFFKGGNMRLMELQNRKLEVGHLIHCIGFGKVLRKIDMIAAIDSGDAKLVCSMIPMNGKLVTTFPVNFR
jgi:hypothetical protein